MLSHDCATRLNDLARGGTSPSPPTRLHGMCATVPRIVALAQSSVWRNLCAPKVHLCSLIAQLWDNPALCAVLELLSRPVPLPPHPSLLHCSVAPTLFFYTLLKHPCSASSSSPSLAFVRRHSRPTPAFAADIPLAQSPPRTLCPTRTAWRFL